MSGLNFKLEGLKMIVLLDSLLAPCSLMKMEIWHMSFILKYHRQEKAAKPQ
jgi:hypothetical protein